MKAFTKIIESIQINKYFEVSTQLKLIIKADSEGEAGYQADSILGGIKEQSDFVIDNIEEINKDEYEKLKESIESPYWIEKDGYLQRIFEFESFNSAMEFVNNVAKIAEENAHHPRILIDFNKVKLFFRTIKENKITDLDHKMAKKVDNLINI